jgi:hypothetical protein
MCIVREAMILIMLGRSRNGIVPLGKTGRIAWLFYGGLTGSQATTAETQNQAPEVAQTAQ